MPEEPSPGALRQRRRRLQEKLADLGPVIRGSVVTLRMPCTHKGCTKCQSGERHPNKYLSTSKGGKTDLRYIPKALRSQVEECVADYRRAKDILEQLSDINKRLLLGQKSSRRKTSHQ